MQGRLDVSSIDDGMVPSGVAKLPLFRDDLIAIMATDHPLAGRKNIYAEDFKTYNLGSVRKVLSQAPHSAGQ